MRRLLPLLALLLAAAAPPPPHPMLWKLSDADTTIWLFGTIHALPPGYDWHTPTIDAVIAGSDELVLETLLDPDPNRTAALLYGLGMTPGLPPLAERVDAAERTTLADLAARSHIGAATLDGLETWAAALLLTQASLSTLNLGPGIDEALKPLFANKPVLGLETPEQQLGFLDGLPEPEQRRFLASVLDDAAGSNADYQAMLTAWATGDEAAIARSFDDEAEVSPVLRAVLLTRRNQAWAAWLEARLRTPGTAFVAVGAGHLAGSDAVPALLRAKGLDVKRVE